MAMSISEVGVKELREAGLQQTEAENLCNHLKQAIHTSNDDPKDLWRAITARRLLKPWFPHALHQLVYYAVYHNYDASVSGPPLYWFPSL